jgi:hypothetical protein
VAIRREAISEFYFSSEVYDWYGPEEEHDNYKLGTPIQMPDTRDWNIIEAIYGEVNAGILKTRIGHGVARRGQPPEEEFVMAYTRRGPKIRPTPTAPRHMIATLSWTDPKVPAHYVARAVAPPRQPERTSDISE